MKRKVLTLACAGLMAALLMALPASAGEEQEKELTKVTLNEVAHSIFYAPQYAAIELGYFEEEGIDLTLVNGGGADKVMTALISGDAQIGFMGSEASIYVYQEGFPGLCGQFCPADPAGRKLPGREGTGAGFHLGKSARKEGFGRTGCRHAPDGLRIHSQKARP